jgi:hypothetical protein
LALVKSESYQFNCVERKQQTKPPELLGCEGRIKDEPVDRELVDVGQKGYGLQFARVFVSECHHLNVLVQDRDYSDQQEQTPRLPVKHHHEVEACVLNK